MEFFSQARRSRFAWLFILLSLLSKELFWYSIPYFLFFSLKCINDSRSSMRKIFGRSLTFWKFLLNFFFYSFFTLSLRIYIDNQICPFENNYNSLDFCFIVSRRVLCHRNKLLQANRNPEISITHFATNNLNPRKLIIEHFYIWELEFFFYPF